MLYLLTLSQKALFITTGQSQQARLPLTYSQFHSILQIILIIDRDSSTSTATGGWHIILIINRDSSISSATGGCIAYNTYCGILAFLKCDLHCFLKFTKWLIIPTSCGRLWQSTVPVYPKVLLTEPLRGKGTRRILLSAAQVCQLCVSCTNLTAESKYLGTRTVRTLILQ